MIRCVCGIDEHDCMREQQRAQSADPCNDRRDARYAELGITLCSVCREPAHASETDDLDRCEACIPVCRHCGAVDGGSEIDPDGRCVDCRVALVYTNAPAAYDYWYTTQINACAGIDTAGKVWRCVRMAEDRVEAQSDRYRSGWHSAVPPRYWQKALVEGIVRAPSSGGAS